MPLPLLHPRLDLALLARNDDHPAETADWLQEQYEDRPADLAPDVLLMWGQGFQLPGPKMFCSHATDPIYNPTSLTTFAHEFQSPFCGQPATRWTVQKFDDGSELKRYFCPLHAPTNSGGPIDSRWHLPQTTLARWAECVYGEDRRKAVESFCLNRGFSHDLGGNRCWVTRSHDECDEHFPSQPSWQLAVHDHARRVATLFPEVTRRADCPRCQANGWLTLVPPAGDIVRCSSCLDTHQWTFAAHDFVPPEPPEIWETTPGRIVLPTGRFDQPLAVEEIRLRRRWELDVFRRT